MSNRTWVKGKKYLIVTKWGYPFGGGEAYMNQTMLWAKDLEMIPVWIYFTDSKNNPFLKIKTKYENGCTYIECPGGLSLESVENWVSLINPFVVHHQGHNREEVVKVCQKLKVPVMTGYHFWHGLIKPKPGYMGEYADIKRYPQNFEKDSQIDDVQKVAQTYIVSEYMRDVLKNYGVSVENILYPTPLIESVKRPFDDPAKNGKYVVMVNIHRNKGGELMAAIIERCPDVHFLLVRTEHQSVELDDRLLKLVHTHLAESFCIERVEDMSRVYGVAKVLLVPSLVDETFCRVAAEGIGCGIPVLHSGQGNLFYIGSALPKAWTLDPDVKNADAWVSALRSLYFAGPAEFKKSSELAKQASLQYFGPERQVEPFCALLQKTVAKSHAARVMFFVPWCDQGLGIQARAYVKILEENNIKTCVFSYKPYWVDTVTFDPGTKDEKKLFKGVNLNKLGDVVFSEKENDQQQKQKEKEKEKNKRFQGKADEWHHPRIYYSPNVRENVTDDELVKFVQEFQVGKCVIPETCFHRVFDIARLMKRLRVACYAIPNIEIVRRSEVELHRHFTRILCNNRLCYDMFQARGFTPQENLVEIGFHWKMPFSLVLDSSFSSSSSFSSPFSETINNPQKAQQTRFLCLGGMNAFTRKGIFEVCLAFELACRTNPNLHLTVTIQGLSDKKTDFYKRFKNSANLSIVNRHLSYNDILCLYKNTDVTIQVSRHEGLGLGFYESLGMGVPVLTLDTPPHNEIIVPQKTGWVIPCSYVPVVENEESIIKAAVFDPVTLSKKITEISEKRYELKELKENIKETFSKSHPEFVSTFLQSLV